MKTRRILTAAILVALALVILFSTYRNWYLARSLPDRASDFELLAQHIRIEVSRTNAFRSAVLKLIRPTPLSVGSIYVIGDGVVDKRGLNKLLIQLCNKNEKLWYGVDEPGAPWFKSTIEWLREPGAVCVVFCADWADSPWRRSKERDRGEESR